MADYDIKPLHDKLLGVLLAIDKVCREHNLTYYLLYGTMLGAVRHKGFIPWDDDLDIGMPRESYEQFIAHAREWLPEYMEFVCPENDKTYPIAFGKVQDARTTIIERAHLKYVGGIYCDVFPLDGTSENGLVRKLRIAKYIYYTRVLYFVHRDPYRHGHGPSSWIPLLCRKLYTLESIQKRIRKFLMEYPFKTSKLICHYDDHHHYILPKEVFGTPTPIIFEGETFYGVAKSHEYLTICYGDYMKLPPEDQRRQHNFHYLNLEKPYREYKEE